MAPGLRYHPYADELQANPYEIYARLREEEPMYRDPDEGFVALSRFEDVSWAISDWRHFSSASGITLEGLPADVEPEMITMDPPRHDQLRGLVKRAFTPRRVSVLGERIVEHAQRIAGKLDPGDADLVRDAATVLPAIVIAEFLGVPPSDYGVFRSWAGALIQRNFTRPDTLDRARAASAALGEYLKRMIDAGREAPKDDLIGTLLRANVAGGATLSDAELLGFCRLLLVAGNETTSHLIGNALVALGRHPEQRARLAGSPGLLASAVEETLRYDAPVQALARTTTQEVERHGISIAAGTKVVLILASANRDPRHFDEADAFDIGRMDRALAGHLAFGHGIHFCLGATLARREAAAMVGAILEHFPSYELPAEIEILRSGVVRGPASLPVSLTPRVC